MKTDYRDCVLEVVNENIQKMYGCIIPFLGNIDVLEVCSNNITLTIIKELKHVLQLKQYKNCIDNQPCNSVVYTILNPPSGSQKFTTGISEITIKFKNFIVEYFEDSYDYNLFSIFSEIGGSIGILLGMSFMTVIEVLIELHQNFLKYHSTK